MFLYLHFYQKSKAIFLDFGVQKSKVFLQQNVMIKAKYNFPIPLSLLQSLDTEVMVSNNVMVLKAA